MTQLEAFLHAWGPDMHVGTFKDPDEPVPDAAARTNRVVAERLAPAPGTKALEVGCGSGAAARMLARDHRCHVVATDLDAGLLDRAGRAAGAIPGLTFERADHSDLPYPENSFDLVWAVETLSHSPDISHSISEIARVLRPGGRAAIVDCHGSALLDPEPVRQLIGVTELWPMRKWRFFVDTFGLRVMAQEDWTDKARQTYVRLAEDLQPLVPGCEADNGAAENMEDRTRWIDREALGHFFMVVRKEG